MATALVGIECRDCGDALELNPVAQTVTASLTRYTAETTVKGRLTVWECPLCGHRDFRES